MLGCSKQEWSRAPFCQTSDPCTERSSRRVPPCNGIQLPLRRSHRRVCWTKTTVSSYFHCRQPGTQTPCPSQGRSCPQRIQESSCCPSTSPPTEKPLTCTRPGVKTQKTALWVLWPSTQTTAKWPVLKEEWRAPKNFATSWEFDWTILYTNIILSFYCIILYDMSHVYLCNLVYIAKQ